MYNLETYLQELEILFNLDLLNSFEKVDNAIVVTMEDGSRVRVKVQELA